MAKKKWKKIAKNVGKAAVLAGALYGASKLGRKRPSVEDVAATEDINIGTRPGIFPPRTRKWNLGGIDPGATLAAKGGRIGKKHGGRTGKQFGGGLGSTARRDMRSGYYPDDMGMRGGRMYEKGGRVKSMGVAKRGGGVAKR